MEIFCFFIAILCVYNANPYLAAVIPLIFFITPRYPIFLLFGLGLLVALIHQWFIAPQGLPQAQVIPNAQIQGKIASLPQQKINKTQFLFAMEQLNGQPAQGMLQLAWYNRPPTLHAGQHWQLNVKIKKPRNFLNPGSYDYVSSLARHHVFWTGYIRSKNNKLLDGQTPFFDWLSLRERLSNQLLALAPDEQKAGIIQALTLNVTTHISQDDWSLFRRTGTTHLFGISGEHIALVSGLISLLTRRLWSRSSKLCLYAPALSAAGICAFIIALLYAFLAGFEPPVQRALIGCLFYTVYCLGKQRFSAWQVWRYALFIVLCLEPHAVFMQGFYFSFIAVACLLLTQKRWPLKGYKATLALQLSCLIGLMPLTLYWFSYGSINGFIANLFAIPLVGLIIVPLALLTMLFSSFSWAWLLMTPLSWCINLLFKGLYWTEHLAVINTTWPIHSVVFVLSFMGSLLIWVLLPIKPLKPLAFLWFLIPILPERPPIQTGEVQIRVLDVGQGLAVSVHTKNHILLYDTGDQFFQSSDLGTMVILPFYQQLGIKKIDKIVISHPDKDHRGGLKSVQASLPVHELLVNNPKYYHHGLNCHHYPAWQWDGVSFRFLPIHELFDDKNNNSCILQVSTAKGRILFTGDIEKEAEDYLVKTYGRELLSELLIVAHHGSKTSSSYRFLLEVAPRYAIASLGFDNRFHFPHTKTVASMSRLHIPFFRTDECGMVDIIIPAKGEIKPPKCYNGHSIMQ